MIGAPRYCAPSEPDSPRPQPIDPASSTTPSGARRADADLMRPLCRAARSIAKLAARVHGPRVAHRAVPCSNVEAAGSTSEKDEKYGAPHHKNAEVRIIAVAISCEDAAKFSSRS